MLTTGDIVEYCCRTVGDISSDMKEYARRAVRIAYETTYRAHAWRESMRTLEGIAVDPALNGSIFLPYDCEETIFRSLSRDGSNCSRLFYRDRDWIERVASPLFSLPGNLPWYYRGENLAWPYFNPGTLTLTTSDTSSFTVYIEGRDSTGSPIGESFIMHGSPNPDGTVTPMNVTTVYSYT